MSILKDIRNDLEKGTVNLIAEYRDRLFAEAVRLCADHAAAEDLVSRTFVKVLVNIDRQEEYDNLFAWMKTVMLNLYRNDVKRPVVRGTRPVEPEELEKLAGVDNRTVEDLILNSDKDALRIALDRLDPEYRQVVSMYYFSELSLKDIACLLHSSTSSVSRRLQIARQILAAKIEAVPTKKAIMVAALALSLIGATFASWTTGFFGLLPDRASAESAERTNQVSSTNNVNTVTSNLNGEDQMNTNKMSMVTTLVAMSLAVPTAVAGQESSADSDSGIRKATLSATASEIPEKEDFGLKGATLLEFIESTGSQWIDTEFIVTEKSGFDLDVMSMNTIGQQWNSGAASGYGCVMGAEKTGGAGFWWLGTWNHFQTGGFDYAGARLHYPGGLPKDNRVFNSLRNNELVYDPSLGIDPTYTAATPFTATGSLGLFADKNSDTGFKESASLRLYGLKLYEGDEVKRDYLPCLDPDGVACLYDGVAGGFVYNCGSGTFVTNGAAVCVGLGCQEVMRDGELLMATVARQTDLHCAWKVYALFGANYHGTDKDAWIADGGIREAGSIAKGVTSANVSVSDLPESARYLRFCAVPETVDCIATAGRWSTTVDCVEAGQAEGMAAPRFASAEVASTAFVSAKVSIACAWKGKGASGYDVLAVYGRGGCVYTNRLVSGATTVGSPVEYVLDGLLPHLDYTLHFLMVNDASDSVVRFPVEGELTFSTKAEFRTRLSDFPNTEQLEYVTFLSGAHVDTGIVIENHQIECRFYDDGFVQDKHVFGSQADYNYTHFTVWQESGTIAWYWGVKGAQGHGGEWSAGEHTVLFNDINEHKVYVDGEALTVVGTAPSGSRTNNQPLWIGRRGSVANFTGRIYSVKITDANGNVVSDLVPCSYTGNGDQAVVGLFDVARGAFRPSLGRTLEAGPTISAGAPVAISNAVLTVWRSDNTRGRLNAQLVSEGKSTAVKIYALYGNIYGGDSFASWANVRSLDPTKEDDGTLDIKVSNLNPSNRYIRFALVPVDADGNEDRSAVLWSDTRLVSEFKKALSRQGLVILLY